MVDKSGIFSLIDEKKFSYKDYTKDGDKYTYVIEKIFNYENYLFVLFSKLFLEKIEEGDSRKRNHLYLITIDKNGREINFDKNSYSESSLERELFEIIDNFDNNENAARVLDLKEGKYKNVAFIDDEAFNITISRISYNSGEANEWARVYRKLRQNNGKTTITYKTPTTSENQDYIVNGSEINITDEDKETFTYNDIDQFITLYDERSTKSAIKGLGSPFGRIGLNQITNLNGEERELLESINDENRMLYNYEYYWDANLKYENYARNMMHFNNFLYSRDYNDITEKGQTNIKKLFPYFETNYVGGRSYTASGNDEVNPYIYKDLSFITDNLLSTDIDDNYINFHYMYNNSPLYISNNICNIITSEPEISLIHLALDKVQYNMELNTVSESENTVYDRVSSNLLDNSNSYGSSLTIQYINIPDTLAPYLGVTKGMYLQPFKTMTFFDNKENKLSNIYFGNSSFNEDYFDWVESTISKIDITKDNPTLTRTALASNYRVATFMDSFSETFSIKTIILNKFEDLEDEDTIEKLNGYLTKYSRICYIESVNANEYGDNSALPFYIIKEYLHTEEDNTITWSFGNKTILMIIPKDSNCNVMVNNIYDIPLKYTFSKSNGSVLRTKDTIKYIPDEEGVWSPLTYSVSDNNYFYNSNKFIKKANKTFINNVSVSNNTSNTATDGDERKFYMNTNLYDIKKELSNLRHSGGILENSNETSTLVYSLGLEKVFGVIEDNNYLNNNIPLFLTSDLTDGRNYQSGSNIFSLIARHYMVSPNTYNYDKFITLIKKLNPFGATNKKYLYIVAKSLTNIQVIDRNDSEATKYITEIKNITNMNGEIQEDTYFYIDIFNLEELSTIKDMIVEYDSNDQNYMDTINTTKMENISMEKLMTYYEKTFKMLMYYSLMKDVYFYFTDEVIPLNTTVMNSLGMYKKDTKYPFESINGIYTDGYTLKNNQTNKSKYFNGTNVLTFDDGTILKEKFICSSRKDGVSDFISESKWCDEKIATYGDGMTKPTITKNSLYTREFTFNNYPSLSNVSISNSYTIDDDASNTFSTMNIESLVNVNDLGTAYIFNGDLNDSSYSLKQYLLINSDIPIFVLNSFTKNQNYQVIGNNITKENFLNEIYMNLVYNISDNSGISIVGPHILAQIALKENISSYYIADLSEDLCIYYVSYINGKISITKIQNDKKLVTIIGKKYAGIVDITLIDSLTNNVSITPPITNTLGIKISKSTDEIKIIHIVSNDNDNKYLNTYINNETLGKFKSIGSSSYKNLIPAYSDTIASNYYKTEDGKIKALFYDETKYIGYVSLTLVNELSDINAAIFSDDIVSYKATITCPKNLDYNIESEATIYVDKFVMEPSNIFVSGKKYFEKYLLDTDLVAYDTYLDDHNHKSLNYTIDNSYNKYSLINEEVEESYIDHFIGTSKPSEIFYIGCVYGKIYTNFNLRSTTGDPNFKNFFKINGYTYIPYANFHTEKYVLLTGDDDNPNAVTSRQLSILKNNGISELDLDNYIANFNDSSLVNYYFLQNIDGYTDPPEEPDGIDHFKINGEPKVITTYETELYDHDNPEDSKYKKKELSNPPNEVYCIEVNFDNLNGINAVPYLINEENKIENHFDYLNLLDNKTPFYRLKYTPVVENTDTVPSEDNVSNEDESEEVVKDLPKYKYYAFSVNNIITICRTVSDIDGSKPFVELLGVLKFAEDIILCGNEEYIVAINNQWSVVEDKELKKKFGYKTSYLALKYEDIINHIYNHLNEYILINNKDMNIFSDIEFIEDTLYLKDNIIEETSIIDDAKSDYYDLENQTVITSNLMEINYAKLYNTNEADVTLEGQLENEYRLFVCMNGRVLVSNKLFDFTHKTETIEEIEETEDETITTTKTVTIPNAIELVDFYTINGRVNNIYIETIDIDNNDLMCIASDKNELYIFKNLFKYNCKYYKRPYEEYFSDTLTRRCLKYIYNFNNLPLTLDEEIEDDPRREYYRETLTPTILNIGSSVDDITVCDKYLNTLNKEITKINREDEDPELIFTNNIKYFKLSEDLVLNSDDINVEGDNKDDNNYFDDNNNYIKIESFRLNEEETFIEPSKRVTMLNFHLNINNRIVKDNEYYTFNYYLESTDPHIILPDEMLYHSYNLIKNSVIYETNNIFKNIYVYIPNDTLKNSAILGMKDDESQSISKSEKYYLLNYENVLNDDSFGNDIFNEKNNVTNNSKFIYTLPLKLHYDITYSLFENEKTPSDIINLPKKLTTRDHFVATVNDGTNEINRLYFRWRYLGDKPANEDPQESDIEFDYYLLSFTRRTIYSYISNNKDMMKYITLLLRNYAMRTFDSTYNSGDFSINKIEFDGEYHWTSLNLPKDTPRPKLFNIIVAKKKGDPPSHNMVGHNPYQNNYWFDEVIFDENFIYMTKINMDTIRKVNIPYNKVAISFEDYINFLEFMEGAIVKKSSTIIETQYNIEWAYQPSISWNNKLNFVVTTNTIDLEDISDVTVQNEILKNVHNNFIFVSNHDYYYQNNVGYENSLVEKGIVTSNINPYYNEEYDSNIYYDFIKWKYNYDSYEQYEEFLWSLILDEEDIHNYKVNSNDGSFEMKDTTLRDNWWYTQPNDTDKYWWEDSNYRNSWINENYMPIKNTLYTDEVKVYTDEVYNNGFNHNINYDDFGLIYLSEDISNIIHYGIEKRLITSIYIDGLKVFNEGYYFKDLLNNCQDIFINPNNLKSYFADTKKFPYFSQLLYMMNEALKPTYEYNEQLKLYELWETDPTEYMRHHEFAPTKPDPRDVPLPVIDIRKILSNIEVNTNFGLVSEQEKLVATIDVINTKDKDVESDITRMVKALNDEGAYFINQYYDDSSNDDLVLDQNKINDSANNVFTNSLKLLFTDEYIKNIVNNNDRINVYISYKNDVGGKYARRINPKFVNLSVEKQNVNLEIKGLYQYENISTIYIVSGDINNHNMFFKNIDNTIEYIDLMELGNMGNGRLFKWLSYDTIFSAEDVEINMNGYILYPNIDYTVVGANYTNSATNLIMFRNIVPSNGEVSVELNLRPDNNAKLVYKTNQAYSLCYEKYNSTSTNKKDLKKVPISKTITMDNDRYQFLTSNIDGEITNKFDIYINNMKVPNKYIRTVNSKTVDLLVDNKDYAIDLHKTHIAKNKDENTYELTTVYDKDENYRYFDPKFENILIVFQNKYNPYNYEIEIANKYSEDNFISLLKNLFFRLGETEEGSSSLKKTDSCYTPSNSVNVYDNFDWICESNGGTVNNINSNVKIDLLNNAENIINCNIDSLTFNISFDSEPIENSILKDNILFDCNPLIGDPEKLQPLDGEFKFDSFEWVFNYTDIIVEKNKFKMEAVYSHDENCPARKIVLYRAEKLLSDQSDPKFVKTDIVYYIPEEEYTLSRYDKQCEEPYFEYPTSVEEYMNKDIEIYFKLIAFDEDNMNIAETEVLRFNSDFGEVTINGEFAPDINRYVYDEGKVAIKGVANIEPNSIVNRIILVKANPETDEFNITKDIQMIPEDWKKDGKENVKLPINEDQEYIIFDVDPADFNEKGIRCKFVALTKSGYVITESEVLTFKIRYSDKFIISDKDPNSKTCSLILYIGDPNALMPDGIIDPDHPENGNVIPYKVKDPIDITDEMFYTPTVLESTCFNYSNITNIDLGKTITEIR